MISENPMVSIIIPVYNGSNYLREAIDSALAQTYSNIEIIVVNDGSNDGGATEAIAASYGKKIRYFSKPNGGVATALNFGIEKMNGDYFSWLSHDDVYFPDKVAVEVQALRTIQQENVILYSDYVMINELGEKIADVRHDTDMLAQKPLYAVLRGGIHGCTLLVPKTAFTRFGLFDVKLRTTQDYDLWFKMQKGFTFVHLPQMLIQSRIHEAQDSRKNPATLREANELWIGFYQQLLPEEMLRCERTIYLFLFKMAEHLASTPYTDAYQYYCRLCEQEKQRVAAQMSVIKVSVVLPVLQAGPAFMKTWESIQQQSHPNIEILLIANDTVADDEALQRLVTADSRSKVVRENCPGEIHARNHGMAQATGKYVAFLSSGDCWQQLKLEKQLLYMELHGSSVSHTGDSGSLVAGENTFPKIIGNCTIKTSTVMIRKQFIQEYDLKFSETVCWGSETCFWIEAAAHQEIGFVEEALAIVGNTQRSPKENQEKNVKELINICYYVINRYPFATIEKALVRRLSATLDREILPHDDKLAVNILQLLPGILEEG